jgi:hypothetical protein
MNNTQSGNNQKLNFFEYMKKQGEEILGKTNLWYTGKKLGRKPTSEEAAEHYIDHGGAVDFNRRFGHLLEDDNEEYDF